MKKSTQEETKLHNSRLVLRTIYQQEEISRVDISRRTGLTRTTVSEIVSKFQEEGLVTETGTSPSRGGKPAVLLRIVSDARHLIGVDLANNEFRGAVVNLRGQICQRLSLPVQERKGEAALMPLYGLLEQLLALTDRPVLGIGIGVPGLVNPQDGVVLQALDLEWTNLPLIALLRTRFPLPIYLANDSQAAALGEYTFGNPTHCSNLVVVKAGRGISAGVVLDGHLFHGDNAGAGEIGHVQVITTGGERCRCGNWGCLETIVSSRALVQRAQILAAQEPASLLNQLAPSPQAITLETVLQALTAGDPAIQALVAETGYYLGWAVAHIVSVLNLNHIVLAGSLTGLGPEFIRPVQEQVQRGVLAALARPTTVTVSTLGDDIVILGAASLLMNNILGLA